MTFELLHDITPSRADMARVKLLEAGLQCFASRGLDGVTIREIARLSGQNSASITYYFGGKEGLYRAVLDAVMRFFKTHFLAAEQHYRTAAARGPITREIAITLLKGVQRAFALGVLTNARASQFAMLMVREQNQPTEAFDSLYQDTIEPLHRMISTLLAHITGDEPDSPQAALRAHTLIGQLQSFVMARETVLRRMGWDGFTPQRAALVADMLAENLDIFVAGLGPKSGKE